MRSLVGRWVTRYVLLGWRAARRRRAARGSALWGLGRRRSRLARTGPPAPEGQLLSRVARGRDRAGPAAPSCTRIGYATQRGARAAQGRAHPAVWPAPSGTASARRSARPARGPYELHAW